MVPLMRVASSSWRNKWVSDHDSCAACSSSTWASRPLKSRARRLHFAQNLIEQTDMPMAEIAFNSGFRSIRQFNHALLTTVGRSPRELRRLRDKLAIPSRPGELAMRLSYRPPFHWPALIRFLESRATPGVELVTADCYQRTVDSEAGAGV